MRSLAARVVVSCLFAAACGRTPTENLGATETGPGSGSFSVTSDRPVAGSTTGASYSMSASFTTESSCTSTTIGACTVKPCYQSTSSGNGSVALPTAGQVTVIGTTMTSLTLDPQSDGNYANESVTGELPWQMGGEALTFQWSSFPGNAGQPGDSITLSTPPYIALTMGSAFAALTSTVVRDQDLTVLWTNDNTPTELDEVSVDVTSDSVQVYCIFSAASGSGVVPAAVLESLEAGDGNYNVISKEHASLSINEGEGAWSMSFNINALARSGYGLARGSVTIQ